MKQWFKDNIVAAFGDTTNNIADSIAPKDEDSTFDNKTVKEAMPWVAAGAVGVAGIALLEPLTKLGRFITRGVKSVITGFGYFEKIPLIGGAFTFAGEMVDKVSEYSGYALTGVGSFLAYNLFQSKPNTPLVRPHEVPDSGTGAVPEEPEKKTIKEKDVVYRPKPVKDAKAVEDLREQKPEVAELTYPMLREMRIKTLREATKDPILAEQLRALMQQKNQQYENRRLFLERVSEFDSDSPHSSRMNLVALMQAEGLTEDEAKRLVPAQPKLRYTVTAGKHAHDNTLGKDGKPTDFAGEYEQLDQLACRIEGFCGKGFFEVSKRTEDGKVEKERIAYAAMSVTQKQEFIQQGISHVFNKYTTLAPLVQNRTAVTSVNRAGGATTTSWVDYSKLKNISYTYHDQDGNPKVVNGKDVYHFVAGLNGDSVRVTDYRSPNYMYQTSGTQVDLGREFASVGNAFKDWQTLLDKHRYALEIAETTYKGEISQYIEKVQLLDYSAKLIDKQQIALLSQSKNYLVIKDLRGENKPGGKGTKYTLMGEWVGDGHKQFIVRGFEDSTGKQHGLKQAVTVDLAEGTNFSELIVNLQTLSNVKVAQNASLPIVVSLDRTSEVQIVTVQDPNLGRDTSAHRFVGTFEGNKFTATGMLDPYSLVRIPPLPADKKLPRRSRGSFWLDGDMDDAVTGTYIYGGIVYREVSIKGPGDRARTMVIARKPDEGDGYVYRVSELSENDKRWRDYSWYEAKGRHPYTVPGTEVKINLKYDWSSEDHMAALAKDAAALYDNRAIDLENEARQKKYEATYPEYKRRKVIQFDKPVVIPDVNDPAAWQSLVNARRFSRGNVIDKATAHESDPLKTATHMMEIKDKGAEFRYSYKLLVHGAYNKEKDTFEVQGYELRPIDLPDNQPGRYTKLEQPVTLASYDDYAQISEKATETLRTTPTTDTPLTKLLGPDVPRPALVEAKDEVKFVKAEDLKDFMVIKAYQFVDQRKGMTPQKITLMFLEDEEKPGSFQFAALVNGEIAEKDVEKMNKIMPFYAESFAEFGNDKKIVLTKEEIDALTKDPKKAAEFIDKHSALAKANITMDLIEAKDEHVVVRMTDHSKKDKPTYDVVMTATLRGRTLQVIGWAKPDSKDFTPVSGISVDPEKLEEWKGALQKVDEAAKKGKTTARTNPEEKDMATEVLGTLTNIALPGLKAKSPTTGTTRPV